MKIIAVEALTPGQRFTEVGLSPAALADEAYWYVCEWVNPVERTYSFHTDAGMQPGSMHYSDDARVVIREEES